MESSFNPEDVLEYIRLLMKKVEEIKVAQINQTKTLEILEQSMNGFEVASQICLPLSNSLEGTDGCPPFPKLFLKGYPAFVKEFLLNNINDKELLNVVTKTFFIAYTNEGRLEWENLVSDKKTRIAIKSYCIKMNLALAKMCSEMKKLIAKANSVIGDWDQTIRKNLKKKMDLYGLLKTIKKNTDKMQSNHLSTNIYDQEIDTKNSKRKESPLNLKIDTKNSKRKESPLNLKSDEIANYIHPHDPRKRRNRDMLSSTSAVHHNGNSVVSVKTSPGQCLGVQMRMTKDKLEIMELREGSPLAGTLNPGDILLNVNNHSLSALTVVESEQIIKSLTETGEEMRLCFLSPPKIVRKRGDRMFPGSLAGSKIKPADCGSRPVSESRGDQSRTQEEKIQKEIESEKAARNLLRPLSEEEHDRVQKALYGAGTLKEQLATSATDSVQRKSMQTLRPGIWLNDEVIHYFYKMLANRDEALTVAKPERKRSHFFKSFFFTKLFDEGNTNEYSYSNVEKWNENVPGKDIFDLDKVFFACNVNQMHWTCAVIFIQEKRIQFYDSMGGEGCHYSEGLLQYLKDEWAAKKRGELPDADKWEIVEAGPGVPQQRNGYDCGVFTCMFADFLSVNRPLSFNQAHITECRHRIALSVLKGVAIE